MPTNPSNQKPLNSLPEGKFFHAAAQADLQQTRPVVAFVPNTLIQKDGSLDMENYRAQRWHTINAGANHHAIGSHIFPDMTNPANEAMALVTELKINLRRLVQKSVGAPSKSRLPGKAGRDSGMEM